MHAQNRVDVVWRLMTGKAAAFFVAGAIWGAVGAAGQRALADACLLSENGSGLVDLPADCEGGYTHPEQYVVLSEGLPASTTIRAHLQLDEFGNVVRTTGGVLGGDILEFDAVGTLTLTGRGELEGWSHETSLEAQGRIDVGPVDHTGWPVFRANAELVSLEAELPGADSAFDVLRVTGGSGFGRPSAGWFKMIRNLNGVCQGSLNYGESCASHADCPDSNHHGTCEGGSNDGMACAFTYNCPGGVCINRGLCDCSGGCDPRFYTSSLFELDVQLDYVGRTGGPLAGVAGSASGVVDMMTGAVPVVAMRPVGGEGREIPVRPGGRVVIEAYVRDLIPARLRAYQASFPHAASGGAAGSVVHDGARPVVDEDRLDFVFGGMVPEIVTALYGYPLIIGFLMYDPAAGPVVEEPKYLGEVTYEASEGASGLFTIDFVDPSHGTTALTVLYDPVPNPIVFRDYGAVIRMIEPSCATTCSDGLYCNGREECIGDQCVGGAEPCADPALSHCDELADACLECLNHTHCDDSLECTVDTCDEGTCTHTFAAIPAGRFDVGAQPVSVVAGDFDADGRLDLATANQEGESVSILMRGAHGGFVQGEELGLPDRPFQIVSARLNGDEAVDLAVVGATWGVVSVLLNDGEGGFTRVDVPNSFRPGRSIAAGDLDGDGDVDLAATLLAQPSVQVLLNDGHGNLSAGDDSRVGRSARRLALGDLDGDGDLDIVVPNRSDDTISALLNRGDGVFPTRRESDAGIAPVEVAIADLDGDGGPEVVVVNADANAVTILDDIDSGGVFRTGNAYAVGADPRAVAVGDVDLDGDLDLAVANHRSDTVTVLFNDGEGGFDTRAAFNAGSTPVALALADIYGDSAPDLVIANWLTSRVTTLLNDGEGAFIPKELSHCVISDTCRLEGTCNPASPCQICDPNESRSEWTWDPNCLEDNCGSAGEVSLGINHGSNDAFGPDVVEASCQPDSNHDAWYRYTAPCTARHRLTTEGSILQPVSDTVLSLYEGCEEAELACDDNSGPGLLSELTFDAEAGTAYYIRVAGVGESVGDITLNIETLERCIRRHDRMDSLEPGLERARRPSKRTPVGIGRDDR